MTTNTVNGATAFSAKVIRFIQNIEYRPANTEAELDAIRHLRYTAYLKEGAIDVSEDERLLDEFDELGKPVNIGLYFENKLISALRLHVIDKENTSSPAMQSFPDILSSYIAAGKRFIDPNRFVADYDGAHRFPELPYATLRLSMMACAYHKADFITATVRAEHHAFYKRSFFATPVCPPRDYPLLSKKIGLMLVDYGSDRDLILKRGPYYASTPEERAALFAPRSTDKSARNRLQSAA